MEGWVEREMKACEFPDQRLKTRFGKLLGQLGRKMGAALPAACQDWAATKAAYRFFSNPRVDESIILAGHFAATQALIAASHGPILILHDTTELSFQRERPEAIGQTRVLPSARIGVQPITQCGLLMHSSLAITTAGKPLGLTAVKFWTLSSGESNAATCGRNAAARVDDCWNLYDWQAVVATLPRFPVLRRDGFSASEPVGGMVVSGSATGV